MKRAKLILLFACILCVILYISSIKLQRVGVPMHQTIRADLYKVINVDTLTASNNYRYKMIRYQTIVVN